MPNDNYANEPNQSRSEEIIQSILDDEEYNEPARSRIEYLLIQLKTAIEHGGSGTSSYDGLTGKPKIDNHELQTGNNTSSDLGLQTKIDFGHKLSADVIDDTSATNKFNVQANWNESNSSAPSYINNKPTLGTASALNVASSGDASLTEVVKGDDSRLADARNAKDVYNWAKQSSKPSYNGSEIPLTNYVKPQSTSAVSASDSANDAIGKLEKALDGKQDSSSLGTAAFTASTDYATASQGSKADSAIQSSGTGLSKSGTTLNHSNSITAKTTQGFAQIAYDAQGHITASTAATQTQLDAMNSGINSTKVAQIATNEDALVELVDGGAKNLLDLSKATSVTKVDEITYSINSDGSLTVTWNNLTVAKALRFVGIPYIAGELVLSGCPSGGDVSTYRSEMRQMVDGTETNIAVDNGAGSDSFELNNDTFIYVVRIATASGTATFKPMVCTKSAWGISHTYQPYRPSYQELYERVVALEQENT